MNAELKKLRKKLEELLHGKNENGIDRHDRTEHRED